MNSQHQEYHEEVDLSNFMLLVDVCCQKAEEISDRSVGGAHRIQERQEFEKYTCFHITGQISFAFDLWLIRLGSSTGSH